LAILAVCYLLPAGAPAANAGKFPRARRGRGIAMTLNSPSDPDTAGAAANPEPPQPQFIDLTDAELNVPWWRQLTGYHWFVFIVASAAWFFDCLDQRIFSRAFPHFAPCRPSAPPSRTFRTSARLSLPASWSDGASAVWSSVRSAIASGERGCSPSRS
jgi:hypothetical protein